MNSIFDAAAELQSYCIAQAWKFCFIGGLAVQRWGEPRLTLDADLSLLTRFEDEGAYTNALLDQFESRIPDPKAFAIENRVLLLKAANGVALDISLAEMPFEERIVNRASPFAFHETEAILTCSAEDLIVLKTFAGRPRDWHDIETTIQRQGQQLDIELIENEVKPLLTLVDAEDRLSELRALFSKAGLTA